MNEELVIRAGDGEYSTRSVNLDSCDGVDTSLEETKAGILLSFSLSLGKPNLFHSENREVRAKRESPFGAPNGDATGDL